MLQPTTNGGHKSRLTQAELLSSLNVPVDILLNLGRICSGRFGFFFIETGLLQRGNYGVENPKQAESSIESFAKMNLIGDGIHNFVDGILIASSFLVGPALGLATTIAIVLHEIPQEISDIAVLKRDKSPCVEICDFSSPKGCVRSNRDRLYRCKSMKLGGYFRWLLKSRSISSTTFKLSRKSKSESVNLFSPVSRPAQRLIAASLPLHSAQAARRGSCESAGFSPKSLAKYSASKSS